MKALICCAVNFLSSILTFQSVPIWRLTERIVRSTLVTACRFATSPTSTSPLRAKATTEGVVREPSELAMTVGSPPSRTATTELVVPRSMPTARAMVLVPPGDRAAPRMKLSEAGSIVPQAVKGRPRLSRLGSIGPSTWWPVDGFARCIVGFGVIVHALPVTTQGDPALAGPARAEPSTGPPAAPARARRATEPVVADALPQPIGDDPEAAATRP